MKYEDLDKAGLIAIIRYYMEKSHSAEESLVLYQALNQQRKNDGINIERGTNGDSEQQHGAE